MKEQIPPAYNLFKPHAIVQAAKVNGPESTFEFQLDSKIEPPTFVLSKLIIAVLKNVRRQ